MRRRDYIKQAVEEHLKTPAYRQISASQAKTSILHLRYKYLAFVSKHKDALGDEIARFMMRGYTLYGDKVAKFRFTVKVHKQPIMLRPVVSKVGTYIECVSKWLDYTLQALVQFLPSVVKDGKTLRDMVIELVLPKNAWLFTADAVSMYTNIDLVHAFTVMKAWM